MGLMDRGKEYNLWHVYYKGKGWLQKSQETFQNNLEEGLRWKGREKWTHTKRFEVKMFFSPLKISIPIS